jgi:hypothetical protein
MMRKHYYYVRWGDHIRMAEGTTIEEACKYAYGMVGREMYVKDLGTRHPKYMSHKRKMELQNSTEGWVKV